MKITLIALIIGLLIITPVFSTQILTGASYLRVLNVKYDPYPAEPDGYLTVWLEVENFGSESADNLTVEIVPEYPFSLVPGETGVRNYGRVWGMQQLLLQYKLLVDKDAPDGDNALKYRWTMSSGNSWAETNTTIVIDRVPRNAELSALFVETTPKPYPGAEVKLAVDIANRAPGTAYYLVAKASSDIAVIERDEMYIGDLKADDFDAASFILNIKSDTAPGTYPVKITMEYKDKDYNEKIVEDSVDITVYPFEAVAPKGADVFTALIYLVILVVVLRAIGYPFIKWFVKPFKKSSLSS
ncbi:MAG: hypothetical protein ABIG30_00010 [Candidatus Aenigmatarchaeota archaeon]